VLGAAAALRLYYAETLGLPPLAAAELSVVRGRLIVSAKLLRALAVKHGYRVERVEIDDEHCVAAIYDGEHELGRSEYKLADAERAGLLKPSKSGKPGAWQQHPRRMLWARASKFAVDDYAPHVSLGLTTEDELAEIVEGELVREDDDGEPEPEPEPAAGWTDKQRRTVFAIVGELDRRFSPPPEMDGEQPPDWRDVVDRTVRERYGVELREVSELQASELIEWLGEQRRALEHDEADRAAAAAREAEREAVAGGGAPAADDDIPF
jgi:hypothetical protein